MSFPTSMSCMDSAQRSPIQRPINDEYSMHTRLKESGVIANVVILTLLKMACTA